MARGDGFYERFASSIAPSIFGSAGSSPSFLYFVDCTDEWEQISRKPSRVFSSEDRRRSCPTVCDCEETSTSSSLETPEPPSLSSSNSSRRSLPSPSTRPGKEVRLLD
jgi:hypothetical protein